MTSRMYRIALVIFAFAMMVLSFFAIRNQYKYPKAKERVYKLGEAVKIDNTDNVYITGKEFFFLDTKDVVFADTTYDSEDTYWMCVKVTVENRGNSESEFPINGFLFSISQNLNDWNLGIRQADISDSKGVLDRFEKSKDGKVEYKRAESLMVKPGEKRDFYLATSFTIYPQNDVIWNNRERLTYYFTISQYPTYSRILLKQGDL